MLPSAHIDCVGVLIASFRSSIPSPPIPLFTLRCEPRGATTQNSGPSGSLLLFRRDSSSPASCRFSPAHRYDLFTPAILESSTLPCRCTRNSARHVRLQSLHLRQGGREPPRNPANH